MSEATLPHPGPGGGPGDQTLARVRVVLVETTHGGNLGAAARAMKTMGLSRLALVNPRQAPDAEALARASGADDLLENAEIHPTLPAALVGCRLVIGTSARARSVEWPVVDPAEAARLLLAESAAGEVALVFGRESSGLTNDELGRCQYLLHIPTNPAFSSLNLAAAVQVLAYELRRAWVATLGETRAPPEHVPAPAEQLEGLHEHLARAIVDIGYADPAQCDRLLRRLRRLFNRARPDPVEVNILRGILSAAQGRKTTGRFARSAPAADPEPGTGDPHA